MRIAEYKQVSVETVTNEVPVLDDEGNEIGTETVTRDVPVFGIVYRDMTPEEEAQAAAEAAALPAPEPTLEEQVDALTAKQGTYATETDDALFDLVDYITSLEARIEELEARNG